MKYFDVFALVFVVITGCQLVTEDFESEEWFKTYQSGSTVAGEDYCYDFLLVYVYKNQDCGYMIGIDPHDQALEYYETNDRNLHSYLQCTRNIEYNGNQANGCLKAITDLSCQEFELDIIKGKTLPEACTAVFAQ